MQSQRKFTTLKQSCRTFAKKCNLALNWQTIIVQKISSTHCNISSTVIHEWLLYFSRVEGKTFPSMGFGINYGPSMVLPPLYPGSLIPPRDQLWTHFPPSHPQPNPIPSSTQPPPVPPLQRQGCVSSLTTTTLIIPLFATRQTIDHIYQWRATLNNICISCSFFVSLRQMVLFVHFGEILPSGNVNL